MVKASALAEETGLIGLSVIFFLFSILLSRIIKIALLAKTNFLLDFFASDLIILLFSQIFIHISVNLGILPTIGIPLPLVSYPGSNLIATFIALGIILSIKKH